jgi:hypothetical protein
LKPENFINLDYDSCSCQGAMLVAAMQMTITIDGCRNPNDIETEIATYIERHS